MNYNRQLSQRQIKLIKKLWDKGLSAVQISDEMGGLHPNLVTCFKPKENNNHAKVSKG